MCKKEIVEGFLESVFQFYPGFAGEHGIVIESLGDYSILNINNFLGQMEEYKRRTLLCDEDCYLVDRRIDMLIEEIKDEFYSRTFDFYYERAFLTLHESLSTTDDKEINISLLKARLGCLDRIVNQAKENIKDEYISRMEIMNTSLKFKKTCFLIEKEASEYLDEKYYLAKNSFGGLIEKKKEVAKTIIPVCEYKTFKKVVEKTCDNVLDIEEIYNELLELAGELRGICEKTKSEADSNDSIQENTKSISDLVEYAEELFDIDNKYRSDKVLIIKEEKGEIEDRSYRAKFKQEEESVNVNINIESIDSDEKKLEVVIHEIVPGHLFMSEFYNNEDNRYFKERSFWEGWALICEYISMLRITNQKYILVTAKKLLNNVLIGLICIKTWYFSEKKEDVCKWLEDCFLSREEANRLFLTSLLEFEERRDYFVGVAAFHDLLKKMSFEELLEKVMSAGAAFYYLRTYFNTEKIDER